MSREELNDILSHRGLRQDLLLRMIADLDHKVVEAAMVALRLEGKELIQAPIRGLTHTNIEAAADGFTYVTGMHLTDVESQFDWDGRLKFRATFEGYL